MNVADQIVSFEFSSIDLRNKAVWLSGFVFFHVISLFCVFGFC
ncbi:hypothetical protein FWP36_23210 [Vibrio parahaemolyticus]|nr:hypothetical protein [Vibrio parahaemolyticus]EGQ9712476.1 hypothetical protein [Vibrio parahaemolyticus]EGQ9799230.1 hypothetical protein [Vibrio parahaemolyticus]EGR1752988.1 hypothetical protein [Vibrio parahaemolyticus]